MDLNSRLPWAVGIVWIFLLPALLTHGRCNAELDQELERLKRDLTSFESPKLADAYWSKRSVDHAVLSPDECRMRQQLVRFEAGMERCKQIPIPFTKLAIRRAD